MYPVREIGRFVLVACLMASTLQGGCAAASRSVLPGAVAASKKAVPDWVDSVEGVPCGGAETCVIGIARCAGDGSSALDAARMSGYARLASMAFPVDVAGEWRDLQTIELSGGGEKSRTTISDEVRAELGGRVSGARVVDEYWSLRRVHSVHGVSDCYDGWSLLAMSTSELKSLYPRELQRSGEEVERLSASLAPVEAGIRADDRLFRDGVPVALSVFQDTESAIPGLQPVDGLSQLKGRLAAAEGAFGRRISFTAAVSGVDTATVTSRVALRVAAAGSPLTGMELVLDGCGLDGLVVVTDAGGASEVNVRHESLFSQCALGIRFRGISGFKTSVQVPAPFSGSTVSVDLSATGYHSQRLRGALTNRAVAESARLERARSMSDRPMIEFRLTVKLHVRNPVPYNGRVVMVSGDLEISLAGYSGGRQVISWSSGHKSIRSLGLDEAQLDVGLENQTGQAIAVAVTSFLDAISGKQSR